MSLASALVLEQHVVLKADVLFNQRLYMSADCR